MQSDDYLGHLFGSQPDQEIRIAQEQVSHQAVCWSLHWVLVSCYNWQLMTAQAKVAIKSRQEMLQKQSPRLPLLTDAIRKRKSEIIRGILLRKIWQNRLYLGDQARPRTLWCSQVKTGFASGEIRGEVLGLGKWVKAQTPQDHEHYFDRCVLARCSYPGRPKQMATSCRQLGFFLLVCCACRHMS